MSCALNGEQGESAEENVGKEEKKLVMQGDSTV